MVNRYKVYMHISPSNKIYIGQTKQSFKKRCRGGYKNNKYFTNAIKKYGWDNFVHIVIQDKLSKDEANELEKLLIREFKTQDFRYGYNIQNGGAVNCMSEVVKNKIGKGNSKRVIQYDMQGNLIRIYNSCHEVDRLLNISHSGISFVARTKKSHYCQNYFWIYEEDDISIDDIIYNYTSKFVEQYDLNGKLINTYKSISEASSICNLNQKSIIQCIMKRNNTYANYIWRHLHNNSDVLDICDRIKNSNSYPKIIHMYDLKNNYIKTYNSLAEASQDNSISIQNISKCALGKRKSAGGYKWQYK